MIFLLAIAMVLQDVAVGGFDRDPPVVIAKGEAAKLAVAQAAARKCGLGRVWVWNSALWAHADDVKPDRAACLRRWKAKGYRAR